jgi:hypothetical protein
MDRETRDRVAFNLAVFAVPVIPGPDGARRRPQIGEPGHMERLLSAAPRGSWPLADRWRALSG